MVEVMKIFYAFAIIACILKPCISDSDFVVTARKDCVKYDGRFWHFPGWCRCDLPDRRLKIECGS